MVLKSYLTLNKLEQLKTKQKSLEYQPAHFEKITMPWPGKKHSLSLALFLQIIKIIFVDLTVDLVDLK